MPTIRVPEGCTSPPMVPVADLMVTQTASSKSPMLGETVIHVTQITNDGPDGTGPFVLEIMLPESADVLSADATIGACDQVPIMGMLECQSELADGEIGTYTLEVLYNDFGQQSYCTEVMGEFIDDTPEGQVCTEITVVQVFDRGTLNRCVNSQAVYPLSETTRAQGPREEIHRLWERKALGAGRSQGRSGTSWRTGFEVRSRS